MTTIGDWIEDFLKQIEYRSLVALEREGWTLVNGEFMANAIGPAKALIYKVSLAIAKDGLRGKATNARSAYINCGLVRESSRAGQIDMAVLAALRAVNELWVAESGNALSDNRTAHLPERRVMMQQWADYLDTLKVGGNVIPMQHKAG